MGATMSAEKVVAEALVEHRYKWQSIKCKAGDWSYDGANDFDEHQARMIVAALQKAGHL